MSVTVVYRSAADLKKAEFWYEEGPKMQERAIKAEAEVARLAEINQGCEQEARLYDDLLHHCRAENAKLRAELIKLRKVASIAWNVVETRGMSDVLLNELAGRLADWETWKEGER